MTDEELMALVRDDDLVQLGVLFDRYHRRLYAYFLKLTHDKMLSEDLVQMVFERVIKSRKSFKELSSFKGWIYRIAKNTLTDNYRGKAIRLDKSVSLDGMDIKEEDSAVDNEIMEENKSKLKKALAGLKDEHREIIWLTRFENLDYKETAAVIGLTENAVKARVFRALKSLRKSYFDK